MPKRPRFQDFPLPDRPAGQPLHRWLYAELRRLILAGGLRPGARLPSTRALARQQQIARATVVATFEQLLAEGYLVSRVGSGTRVAEILPDRFTVTATPPSTAPRPIRREPAKNLPPRAFALHEPALDVFPLRRWAQLASRRLRLGGTRLLAHGEPLGHRPLRDAIASHFNATRSVHGDADRIAIVSGTQQALAVVAQLVLRAGDVVWVEEPGYPGAADAFLRAGAKVVPVPVDAAGLDVAAGLRLSPRPALVYVTPAHQFPLGATLALERRLALLALSARTGCWIFEDDYDGEYRYDVRPIGALQGHDRHERVIYAGSFNKLLFPALRLGFIVLPPPLIAPFLAWRNTADRYPPTLEQAVLADFFREGDFDRHLRASRVACLARRDALLAACRAKLSRWLEVQPTHAGFHVVGLLPPGLPDTTIEREATERGDLTVTALSRFYRGPSPANGLLLGFAGTKPATLRAAVDRLAEIFQQLSRRRGD